MHLGLEILDMAILKGVFLRKEQTLLLIEDSHELILKINNIILIFY